MLIDGFLYDVTIRGEKLRGPAHDVSRLLWAITRASRGFDVGRFTTSRGERVVILEVVDGVASIPIEVL